MKRFAIISLAAAMFLSLGTAFAQNNEGKVNFYDVVPKHEFYVDGFAGLGPLLYNIDGTMSHILPWKAGDMFTLQTPVGLGYGGGIGYIWHFTPVWGLMLGADFTVYNGGIDLTGGDENNPRIAWSLQPLKDENGVRLFGVANYQEIQKYTTVQVPLMFQVMAPMGRGNHFFYFAFGAKAAFNIAPLTKFKGTGDTAYIMDYFPTASDWTEPNGRDADIFYFMTEAEKATVTPDDPVYQDVLRNHSYEVKDGKFIKDGKYQAEGRLKTLLVSPLASAEIGFRWRFTRGWGLYTGLYADYGFLPLTPANGAMVNVKSDTATQMELEDAQSILNSEGELPTMHIQHETEPWQYKTSRGNGARLVNSLHAGLKLKLAFGKVRKPIVPVPIPPKPDTVVKTVVQTVVVRDTVTRDNTIVVRDTVEKVKVVRDTVVVIKEVPQEIKDVMVELSNTLFAFNKFNLNDKAQAGLNKVAKWLNDNPDINVEISGHTDSVGSEAYNQKLSEERAKSVYEYFIHHGVSSNRLSYKGYGKSRPIATNDTDEGRQQNRRVELNIIQ